MDLFSSSNQASDKQISFINSLMANAIMSEEEHSEYQARIGIRLDKRSASSIIDELMKMPRKAPVDTCSVPAGWLRDRAE